METTRCVKTLSECLQTGVIVKGSWKWKVNIWSWAKMVPQQTQKEGQWERWDLRGHSFTLAVQSHVNRDAYLAGCSICWNPTPGWRELLQQKNAWELQEELPAGDSVDSPRSTRSTAAGSEEGSRFSSLCIFSTAKLQQASLWARFFLTANNQWWARSIYTHDYISCQNVRQRH